MKCKFKILGLDCANCASELERSLQKIKGIQSANINFMTEKMELQYEENDEEEILKNVMKTIKKEDSSIKIEKI